MQFEYAWTCPKWGKLDCGHLLKMASQFNVNTHQQQWAIPENTQAKQVTGVRKTWNFQGYWGKWKFQGSIKKEVKFPQECSRKTHVEWLGGNEKNVWLFGVIHIIHLPIPKIFFKFPKICGAEEWTYLNFTHKFIQWNSFLKCPCDIG